MNVTTLYGTLASAISGGYECSLGEVVAAGFGPNQMASASTLAA